MPKKGGSKNTGNHSGRDEEDMKFLLTILALFTGSALCLREEELKRLENSPCTDGKVIVEETPEGTHFRIIADSGETLLDVNSNITRLTPFFAILSNEMMLPRYGHWAFANNSRYYITQNQTTEGDVIRFAGKSGTVVIKEYPRIAVHRNMTVIKSDFRCARLHEFSVVVDPAFDVNRYDGYNMTALTWSSWFGLSDVARSLVERGADVNQGIHLKPVVAAILANRPELVEFLIQKGANVIQHDKYTLSTLHVAAFLGRTDIARILIDHGVDVNEDNNRDHLTPLHLAVFYGRCDTLELLLKKGAAIVWPSSDNITAFQVSLAAGHLDCAHTLVAAGADVNARDSDGDTALTYFLSNHQDETKIIETVDRLLREFNPDVNIRNNKGESALAIANKRKFTKIAELLKSKGAV